MTLWPTRKDGTKVENLSPNVIAKESFECFAFWAWWEITKSEKSVVGLSRGCRWEDTRSGPNLVAESVISFTGKNWNQNPPNSWVMITVNYINKMSARTSVITSVITSAKHSKTSVITSVPRPTFLPVRNYKDMGCEGKKSPIPVSLF